MVAAWTAPTVERVPSELFWGQQGSPLFPTAGVVVDVRSALVRLSIVMLLTSAVWVALQRAGPALRQRSRWDGATRLIVAGCIGAVWSAMSAPLLDEVRLLLVPFRWFFMNSVVIYIYSMATLLLFGVVLHWVAKGFWEV